MLKGWCMFCMGLRCLFVLVLCSLNIHITELVQSLKQCYYMVYWINWALYNRRARTGILHWKTHTLSRFLSNTPSNTHTSTQCLISRLCVLLILCHLLSDCEMLLCAEVHISFHQNNAVPLQSTCFVWNNFKFTNNANNFCK